MYLLKLLQGDASVFGQSLTLLSGLHAQLTGLGFQRSNFLLETVQTFGLQILSEKWINKSCTEKFNRTNIDFTFISQWFIFARKRLFTFRLVMLLWYWALSWSSCWLMVSRSSSRLLSFSNCWNSRSSNCLVATSRVSASYTNTKHKVNKKPLNPISDSIEQLILTTWKQGPPQERPHNAAHRLFKTSLQDIHKYSHRKIMRPFEVTI